MSNEYVDRLRKEDWVVKPISIYTARILIVRWHYAKSASNTGVYTHGLFKKSASFFESDCLGVAWWLPPTKAAAVNIYPEGEWQKVLSLTRFVISPKMLDDNGREVDMPKNAASFLLSRSMKMIDTKIWKCLVTYADTWQNHEGTIYKATNWDYMGLTNPSMVLVSANGKMMGRKRGGRNLTKASMIEAGFQDKGNHSKHKFRKILNSHP